MLQDWLARKTSSEPICDGAVMPGRAGEKEKRGVELNDEGEELDRGIPGRCSWICWSGKEVGNTPAMGEASLEDVEWLRKCEELEHWNEVGLLVGLKTGGGLPLLQLPAHRRFRTIRAAKERLF